MKLLSLSALCSLLLAASAPAAVIYSGSVNHAMPVNPTGFYLNPLSGATSTILPGDWNTAPWINPFFGGVYIATDDLLRPVITGADQIVNLASGTVIGSLSTFAVAESGSSTHVGTAVEQFQLGAPGILGFAFQPTTGGSTHYGWMRLTINNTGSGTLHDYAYENAAGTAILAGLTTSVPEPSRVVLMLGGLLAVSLRRRR